MCYLPPPLEPRERELLPERVEPLERLELEPELFLFELELDVLELEDVELLFELELEVLELVLPVLLLRLELARVDLLRLELVE